MKTSTALCGLISGLFALTVVPFTTNAAIVQMGDLNFISDAGNASDGLAFLDMSYSDGLTSAAALTAAQLVYADARLAIASEFDDLFAAAGIAYNGSLTASDGFTVGAASTITSGANYDGGALRLALGITSAPGDGSTRFYTDPDGSSAMTTTRDGIQMFSFGVSIEQLPSPPPNSESGWLLVSDSAAIPEPGRALLSFLGLGAIVLRRRR